MSALKPAAPLTPTPAARPEARTGPITLAKDLLALVRPSHWPKNLIAVALPLALAPDWSLAMLRDVAFAVVAFTVASAIVYVINDTADRERDRRHPVKCLRPIAAGRVPVPVAWAYGGCLAVALAVLLVAVLSPAYCWPVLVYLGVNIAYSRKLKHLPMVDVLVVASGFVLRIVLGYLATGQPIAGWLIVSVLAVCLMLSLGKRRAELGHPSGGTRPALNGYSIQLLDQLMMLNAGLTVVSYLIYIGDQAPLGRYAPAVMLLSAPFALFAIFRYLQVLLVQGGVEDPVRHLLRDRAMVVNFALWAALLGPVLVLGHLPGAGGLVTRLAE